MSHRFLTVLLTAVAVGLLVPLDAGAQPVASEASPRTEWGHRICGASGIFAASPHAASH